MSGTGPSRSAARLRTPVNISNLSSRGPGWGPRFASPDRLRAMERPVRFEHHRWIGDKRTQVVHDVDACETPEIIEELMAAETYLCFGPDELAEARNRGYRRCGCCGSDAS